MGFTITNKVPPPASNKGEVNNVAIKCMHQFNACYVYNRGSDSEGYVLDPRIDFLIITVPVTDRIIQGLIGVNLTYMQMDESEPDWVTFNKSHLPKKAKGYYQKYTHGVKINSLPGLAVIQAKPNSDTHNFLKLTIVPSRWTASDVDKFWSYLSEVTGTTIDADYILEFGNIRRIDWAIDYLNVDISDFLLQKYSKHKRKSISYYGTEGGVETHYIGPNGQKLSPQNFKAYIYDKKASAIEKGHALEFGELLHMRLEIRLNKTNLGKVTMKSLMILSGKVKNRFLPYKLTDFFAANPEGVGAQWHMFGDSCKVRGVDGALNLLSKDERSTFKEALENAQQICWKPDKLWQSTRYHLKHILGKK